MTAAPAAPVGGLFGGGLGSMVVAAWGCNGAYAPAGGVSMAAAIALLPRRPGRTTGVTTSPEPQPAG